MEQIFEIIAVAKEEHFDLLELNALDLVRGGDMSCQKGYSVSDKGTKCSCGYKATAAY
jgi:hypothetical protein